MRLNDLTYVKPHEAGLKSEGRAVGRKLAALLDAMDALDQYAGSGELIDGLWRQKQEIIAKLRAEGWRVKAQGNRWQVLPPKDY